MDNRFPELPEAAQQWKYIPHCIVDGAAARIPVTSSNHTLDMVHATRHMVKHLLSSDEDDNGIKLMNADADTTDTHFSPTPVKNMSNSERGKYYRRKRKIYATKLQQRVAKLKLQVEALVISRQVQQELAVGTRHTRNGGLAKLVEQYVDQFRHGTPVNLALVEGEATTMVARVAAATPIQALFLHATMVDDVQFGTFRGINVLLDQWQRYSSYHAGLEFIIKTLDVMQYTNCGGRYKDDTVVIRVELDLHTRFTRKTIEHVFPHLLGDEMLMQELIGMEITYPSVNHFYFNSDGMIERYDAEMDLVTALMNVIPNLTKVAKILDSAMIKNQHYIAHADEDKPSSNLHGSLQSCG